MSVRYLDLVDYIAIAGVRSRRGGEVGHSSIVKKFNERAKIDAVEELAEWALPIQERHCQNVLAGSLDLAAEEDPGEAQ